MAMYIIQALLASYATDDSSNTVPPGPNVAAMDIVCPDHK